MHIYNISLKVYFLKCARFQNNVIAAFHYNLHDSPQFAIKSTDRQKHSKVSFGLNGSPCI